MDMDTFNAFFLISLLLNVFLVYISIEFFIWGRSLSDKQASTALDKSPLELNQLQWEDLSKKLNQFEENLSKSKQENFELIKEIKEYLFILTKNVSKKDEDIKRLREGYDIKIFKRIANHFFSVYRMVEEDLEFYIKKENQDFIKLLKNLKSALREAFLDCGLEEFSPQKGEKYQKAFGVSGNTVNIETEIESEDMKITEIKNTGFKIKNDYGYEIIKPAVVAIYKYKKKKGEVQ